MTETNPTPTQQETLPRPQPFDKGFWYRSAVSGLWYDARSREAAGNIDAIRLDGIVYEPRAAIAGPRGDVENILNMAWAEESGVAIFIYQAEREDRRIIEIRKGAQVLAAATIAKHNRDNLAESISTGDLRYTPEEVAKLVHAATSSPTPAESDESWEETLAVYRQQINAMESDTAPAESTRVEGEQWRQGMRDAAKEVCDACDNEDRYGPARKIEGSTRWWHGDDNIPCEAGGIWYALANAAAPADNDAGRMSADGDPEGYGNP